VVPPTTMKRLVRAPIKRVRRAFVPEYEDLLASVLELRGRLDQLENRIGVVDDRIPVVEDGLHEARRLNLRIAQLTDVVTELVLPLHSRDIDPTVFEALADDAQ
jgi:hypothetical protein